MGAEKGNMKPGQGFQKGNQWAKLKKGTKSRKVQEWEYMGAKMIGEATIGYLDNLEKLFAGEELTEIELEAMNRYEKLLEYFKPKQARIETKHEGEIELKGVQVYIPKKHE